MNGQDSEAAALRDKKDRAQAAYRAAREAVKGDPTVRHLGGLAISKIREMTARADYHAACEALKKARGTNEFVYCPACINVHRKGKHTLKDTSARRANLARHKEREGASRRSKAPRALGVALLAASLGLAASPSAGAKETGWWLYNMNDGTCSASEMSPALYMDMTRTMFHVAPQTDDLYTDPTTGEVDVVDVRRPLENGLWLHMVFARGESWCRSVAAVFEMQSDKYK